MAQTVHETWQGVDARTGVTQGGSHAGLVLGRKAERIGRHAMSESGRNDGQPAGEYLTPIFDEKGAVVAYERAMDPARLEMLPRDEHLGRMLGVWAGRIAEETASDEANSQLVATMKEIWEKGAKAGQAGEFVNIADPALKDPVIKDAWNTLGWRIKQEIAEAFGPGVFMVRRDMIDDAIGYRAASVTEALPAPCLSPKRRNFHSGGLCGELLVKGAVGLVVLIGAQGAHDHLPLLGGKAQGGRRTGTAG